MDHSLWTHLHTHTAYSLLDGIIKRSDLIKHAKDVGCSAVAVTEHGNILNIIDFYMKCKDADIKPIIGIEMYISPVLLSQDSVKYNDHLLLLAYNRAGYDNIVRLTTLSFELGYKMGRGRIDYDILFHHTDGLIAGSGCVAGRISRLLLDDDYDCAKAWVEHFKAIFKNNFYIELMNNGWSIQKLLIPKLIRLANDTNTPMIATNDVHYLNRDDAYIQDMALAIQTKQEVNSSNRRMSIYENGNPVTDGYFKTLDEMINVGFPDSAYKNVLDIVDRIEDYGLTYSDPVMPKYNGVVNVKEKVNDICKQNWHKVNISIEDMYIDRFNHEMDIIDKLGFFDYFLIIWDIINYCKSHNILTGPGRGSASGSLVVYLLGITEIDPIEYGLYFERFLNPERVSPPDIDFDVEQGRRQEVLQYLRDRWGDDKVVQIGTFNRMAVKDVIKRVGKALAIDIKTTSSITKQIDIDEGVKNHTLGEVNDAQPSIKQQMDAVNKDWWEYSEALCNTPTGVGVHAAGVIISDSGLSSIPTCVAGSKTKDSNLNVVTQFDMNIIEKMGYVKFDLLGLKSLDIIHGTVDIVDDDVFSDVRDIYNTDIIPLDDKDTLNLISSGNTTGVFQLENEGFKGICKSLQPQEFNQIAALNALYRPGPIGSGVLDSYVKRRHNLEEIKYEFPELEEITKDDYGLTLYQEQLMALAVNVAGYTLPQADNLRKIIGKKLVEKIEEEGKVFVERGLDFGKYSEEELNRAYDIIKPAGRYCVTADTVVLLSDGTYRSMEELVKTRYSDMVLSFRTPIEFVDRSVTNWYHNGTQAIFDIHTENNYSIRCTSNHYLLTVDGKKCIDSGLDIGDRLMIYDGGTKVKSDVVTSISYTGVDDTYCITVADTHTMIVNYGIMSYQSWNKAHAVAYGYITYIMAYLKAHYPSAFYATSLNLSLGDSKRLSVLIRDAKDYGINILPPNVNVSDSVFKSTLNGIMYGLQSISGIGKSAASQIIDERNHNGLFEGLLDFVRRVSVNLNHKRALVHAGALDNIDPDIDFNRASLDAVFTELATKKKAKKYKKSTLLKGLKNAESVGDTDLIKSYKDALNTQPDKNDRHTFYPPMSFDNFIDIPEWDDMTIYMNEMNVLGISLSANIDSIFSLFIKWFKVDVCMIDDIKKFSLGWRIAIAGICTRIHKINTKLGDEMAFIEITDSNSSVDITIFPESWSMHNIVKDNPYIIYCNIDYNKDKTDTQLICNNVINIMDGVKVSNINVSYSSDRLRELGTFMNFCVSSDGALLLPSHGTYFMLTRHLGIMLDVIVGEHGWNAHLLE